VNWVFFVRGEESHFIENSLAVRVAETDRVILGPFCQALNTRLFRKEMRRFLMGRPDVLCVRSPEQHSFIGSLQESLSLYSASDDYTVNLEGQSIPGEIERERRLLEKIDQVFCVSEELANRLRERAPREKHLPIHIVPNFYNERVFNLTTIRLEPAALHDVPRPRMLVAGHISNRIDWDSIIAASSLKPDWHWVFLGRATEPLMEERIRQLGARGFLLPSVSFEEVPAWIQYTDACAIPYRLNAFTLASDPIKAPEYLAMGAPVLSTRVPSLARYDQAIYWVEEGNAESYVAALDAIQADLGKQELRAFRQQAAAADSLEIRAQQFAALIRAQL
jgi:glycosyltransferase involved in cell wall biosynthesis